MRCFKIAVALSVLTAAMVPARAATVLVEAEGFAKTGGWLNDPQAMDVMGSPYLLAHGLGEPVADATTTFEAPKAGNYHVWVRTINWIERFESARRARQVSSVGRRQNARAHFRHRRRRMALAGGRNRRA